MVTAAFKSTPLYSSQVNYEKLPHGRNINRNERFQCGVCTPSITIDSKYMTLSTTDIKLTRQVKTTNKQNQVKDRQIDI